MNASHFTNTLSNPFKFSIKSASFSSSNFCISLAISNLLNSIPCKSYPLEISINKKQVDQSSVVIIFDVSIEGEVFNASVYQSSGDRMVDSLALESVRRSIYSPSLLDGKHVIYRKMKKRFRFNL